MFGWEFFKNYTTATQINVNQTFVSFYVLVLVNNSQQGSQSLNLNAVERLGLKSTAITIIVMTNLKGSILFFN